MRQSVNNLKTKAQSKKTIAVYLLMLPAMIYFLLNNYLPMAGIIMAFKKVNFTLGLLNSKWCGLDNFKFLFSSGNALIITRNTILYNLVFIVLGIVLGVAVAILLNEVSQKFASRIYQTLMLLPYLMSWVVVSYLAYAFLNSSTGFIVKSIYPVLGIDSAVDFYQNAKYWPYILVFVNTWKTIGFSTILYLSGIISISPEFYEAARIDGASKWHQIKSITLPCLKPTVITLLILGIGRMFYSDFGLFYQVPKNSGMLYNVTQTIDTYVYNALMTQNNLGMSSAAGLYQSVVGFVLVIVVNWVIKRISPEDALI